MLIGIAIDKGGAAPLHRQITDALRSAIVEGRIAPGARLPSTRVFAGECGISRNTALRVFETLIGEGYLSGRIGAGTFIAETLPEALTRAAPHAARQAATHSSRGAEAPAAGPPRALSRRGAHLIQASGGMVPERPVTFMPDWPDAREFPIKTWLRLLNETSGRLRGDALTDCANAGYRPLRQAIARHLRSSRGVACEEDQVIVTTGSQQSLDLVCRLLLDPGDPIWLEEPGYAGIRAVIRANGGMICPIGVDADGMRVEAAIAAQPAPRLVLVSPSRHYPLGATLSLPRRLALLDLARATGCWILEDDYDCEFRYAGTPLPSIQGLDAAGRTLYIGTFSKVLLPSFRLGYVVVPPDLAEAFTTARAVVDRHASLIEQMVLAEFMQRGLFAAHVRRMRSLYRARRNGLIEGLRQVLDTDVSGAATETGTHVILRLCDEARDQDLARSLAEAGLIARPLSAYYADTPGPQGLVLGFAAFSPAEISQGVARLAAVSGVIRPYLIVGDTSGLMC